MDDKFEENTALHDIINVIGGLVKKKRFSSLDSFNTPLACMATWCRSFGYHVYLEPLPWQDNNGWTTVSGKKKASSRDMAGRRCKTSTLFTCRDTKII